MTSLFDPGLQLERTELAWRRTCLALGAGSLVALRILPAAFGNASWALGGVAGLAVSALLWARAHNRYREGAGALAEDGDRARMPDGRLALTLAVFVTAIGLVSVLVAVWVATASRT